MPKTAHINGTAIDASNRIILISEMRNNNTATQSKIVKNLPILLPPY